MSFRNARLLWKIKGSINLGGHMLVCAHMKADFLINSQKKIMWNNIGAVVSLSHHIFVIFNNFKNPLNYIH